MRNRPSRAVPRLAVPALATVALALALPAALAAPANADGPGSLGVKGWSEKRLRAFETATLGAQHAAEHAKERRFLRTKGGRALLASRRRALLRARAKARKAAVCDAATAATLGCWTTDPFSIPVMGINMAMLPTGKVLIYAYPNNPSWGGGTAPNSGWAAVFDPVTRASRRVDPPINATTGQSTNIWCSGTSFLPDGRVLVTGGTLSYTQYPRTWRGLNQVYTFNPWTETWQRQSDMRHGRWYPTQVELPDGRTLITSGLDETGNASGPDTPLNKDVEIFDPADGSVKLASGADTPLKGMYPHMWQMPSGKVLVAGPYREDSFFLALTGATSYSVTDVANPAQHHYWGTGVLVPNQPNKAMLIGGSDRVTGSTRTTDGARTSVEVFDENNAGAGWSSASALKVRRAHHNTVILPDSSMVTLGGGKGMVYRANPQAGGNNDEFNYDAFADQRKVELWNPSTGAWTTGPAQVEYRTYHSTALLLPDGRVMSAGDDFNGGNNTDTAEIYSPPYLYKGTRPVIGSAPAAVGFGQSFNVDTTSANVTKAVLVAPGASTHANDMSQRLVPLTVSQRTGGVTLTAPANGRVAPPGYYMLFLLNSSGVPSVAKFVQVGQGGGTTPTPTPTPPAGGTNLALGKPATSSSNESASLTPDKAVDGSATTRWASGKYLTAPQTWTVDLGSAQTVSSVQIAWEAAYASEYAIQTSTDGTTFTTAANVTLSAPREETTAFTARSARYVRIVGTKRVLGGISFWEARVFTPSSTAADVRQ